MNWRDYERRLISALSADRMWEHVEYLSKLDRRSGTTGEAEAVAYIQDRLSSWGVDCTTHRFPAYLSHPVSAELQIMPNGEKLDCITHSFARSTRGWGLIGQLATKDQDPRGRIALVDGLLLPERVLSAQRRGAVAAIGVTKDPVLHEMIVTGCWGTPHPGTESWIPDIPAVTVTCHGGLRLRELSEQGPVNLKLTTETHIGWTDLDLPVARIEGADPDRFLLIAGHLDSWHFGVTDNATGDALLLELARVLRRERDQLGRSVQIAWWPGHSTGRYAGSTWYADNLFEELNRDCVANINVDSPGVAGPGFYELNNMSEIDRLIKQAIRDRGNRPVVDLPLAKNADQSFWGIGMPAASMYTELPKDSPLRGEAGGSGGGWWWHNPADTLEWADPNVLYADAVVHAAVTARICNQPILDFRFGPVAAEIQSLIGSLVDGCPPEVVDLSQATAAAQSFAEAAGRLDALAAECPPGDRRRINDCLMRLSRVINPVLYTKSGRFVPDPAVPTPRLPGLAPARTVAQIEDRDKRGFMIAGLIRERNRVVTALRDACTLIDELSQ